MRGTVGSGPWITHGKSLRATKKNRTHWSLKNFVLLERQIFDLHGDTPVAKTMSPVVDWEVEVEEVECVA